MINRDPQSTTSARATADLQSPQHACHCFGWGREALHKDLGHEGGSC
jgi:hypothetical protein